LKNDYIRAGGSDPEFLLNINNLKDFFRHHSNRELGSNYHRDIIDETILGLNNRTILGNSVILNNNTTLNKSYTVANI
jgi:hypothetical protein